MARVWAVNLAHVLMSVQWMWLKYSNMQHLIDQLRPAWNGWYFADAFSDTFSLLQGYAFDLDFIDIS